MGNLILKFQNTVLIPFFPFQEKKMQQKYVQSLTSFRVLLRLFMVLRYFQ